MRLIDADALLDDLKESAKAAMEWREEAQDEEIKIRAEQAYVTFIECALKVKEAPTIEPEVRHGRWVETEPDEDDRKIGIEFSIKCSRCHDENSHLDFNENHEITGKTFWKSRFCPNCGAYMREGGEQE